jgi:chloramphenicol 3-O phosphotransferase
MAYGTIIMLNGTTSAGKTSIITVLHKLLDQPYLHAGIDAFFYMLPPRYLWGAQWNEVLDQTSHAGPVGRTLAAGMHQSIAALARAGNHVLVDHVFLEPEWLRECAALFADTPAYLIGVRCPLEIIEQRELQRGDRSPGQARAQFDRVHRHAIYDFEVNTADTDAATCAAAIKQYLDSGAAPSAFQRLRDA